MELAAIVNVLVFALDVALFALIAYGAFLVFGGGGFRRDAPEDAAQPHLDVSRELQVGR
jgi:hypothetical protein